MNSNEQQDMITLASYLEHMVKDERFCLSSYFGFKDTEAYNLEEVSRDSLSGALVAFEEGKCNTTACAWGYAHQVFGERITVGLCREYLYKWTIKNTDGVYHTSSGLQASMKFFSISFEASSWAFSPTSYDADATSYDADGWPRDRRGVALRLRVLAENNGEIPAKRHYSNYSEEDK